MLVRNCTHISLDEKLQSTLITSLWKPFSKKPISLAPARLQRMLLSLQSYDLNVQYVGSKSVLLVDTLSRLIAPGIDETILDLDINIAQVLNFNNTRLQCLQDETKND